jgi:hypothetical protein
LQAFLQLVPWVDFGGLGDVDPTNADILFGLNAQEHQQAQAMLDAEASHRSVGQL